MITVNSLIGIRQHSHCHWRPFKTVNKCCIQNVPVTDMQIFTLHAGRLYSKHNPIHLKSHFYNVKVD